MAEKKLYIITTPREIPCLGGICGPVSTPVQLERNDVVNLVKKGFEIYQCNPYDTSERVRVTRGNINTITFSRTRAAVTSQRMLNRSIQDMEKPIVADVVKKDTNKEKEEYKNKSSETKKTNETKSSKDNTKIVTPDDFTK